MKKPKTAIDDKGNVCVAPGQMTRKEAEVYFPSQPCSSKPDGLVEDAFFPPPWQMIPENQDRTEGWFTFQKALRDNPDYYLMNWRFTLQGWVRDEA